MCEHNGEVMVLRSLTLSLRFASAAASLCVVCGFIGFVSHVGLDRHMFCDDSIAYGK